MFGECRMLLSISHNPLGSYLNLNLYYVRIFIRFYTGVPNLGYMYPRGTFAYPKGYI